MAELIVALDFPSARQALAMAEKLKDHVRWYKVGLELFVAAGPELLKRLRAFANGIHIFLDLKFFDIPNTAAKASFSAAALGVDMLTVHCQGGERMCVAVMEAMRGVEDPPMVLGVTSLTSFAPGEMPGIALPPGEFGLILAEKALAWGLDGVVCSAQEARAIRSACPALKLVCPGIRLADQMIGRGDQRRITTPRDAMAAGADFLVVGRPITESPDPASTASVILEEIEMAKNKQ